MILAIITLTASLAAIVLAWALSIHKDLVVNLYAENSRLRTSVAELIYQRNDAERTVATQSAQIGGHLKESVKLLFEIEQLKRGVPAELDADAIVGDVVAWLEGESVA